MPATISIDDLIHELQAMLLARADAGMSSTLGCDPPVVVGRTGVAVRAQIVASPSVLATLAPVLGCEEAGHIGGRRLKAHRDRAGEYTLRLSAADLEPDSVYHLTLHPSATAAAIAHCTLYTFSAPVVAAARRRLREMPSGGSIADARPAAVMRSPRRVRTRRSAPRRRTAR